MIILSFLCLFIGSSAQSQILKKLKKEVEKTTEKVLLKKTEEKTEKTVGSAFDSIVSPNKENASSGETGNNSTNSEANTAKLINTEAKREFYTSDVVVKTSDDKGEGSTYYFDSDEIAARGTAPNSKNDIYIDSEAYQYGYNEHEGRWEKTGLMRSDAMAFMMPMMSLGILKLPVGPTMEAAEKLKENGMTPNTFQIVEWAFIYKPEHFRSSDYEETTGPCPGGGDCPKFIYKNPDYKGSWVLFDKQGRLSEIYANVNTQQASGTGTYKFEYTPVSVNIPNAVEVKQPFQDLFMSGADATPPGENRSSSVNTSRSNSTNAPASANVPQNSMESMAGKDDPGKADLPATYEFDWQYNLKMEMPDQKQEALDLVMLLKKNTNYQGINMKIEGSGAATMVFDLNINAMVMFMQSGDNKFLQVHSMKDQDKPGEIADMQIRDLPDKTIIGFNSKGVEIENNEYIAQVYHTNEAPIKMNGLFNFSGPMDKKMPNIDPRLVKQFSEGLVTEMHYTDKKNPKNKVILTAQSLNQVKTSINTGEYQSMNFMGQLKSKN